MDIKGTLRGHFEFIFNFMLFKLPIFNLRHNANSDLEPSI